MNEKNVNLARKNIGPDTVQEMDKMDESALRGVIVQAEMSMLEVKEELEGSSEYIKTKADLDFLSSAKKEVDKRQKAKIQYALHRLEERGEA